MHIIKLISNLKTIILGNTFNLNEGKMQVELNYFFEAETQSRAPI